MLRRILGDNVRRLRLERGLSRRALAELASVSAAYIGRIECGRANVRSTTLAALATALDADAVVLLVHEAEAAHPPAA